MRKPIFVLSMLFFLFASCEKEPEVQQNTDKDLYDLVNNTIDRVYYKNTAVLLPRSSGSGHSQPFLGVWYNQVAAGMLDESGKILENASFPEGSLVVKELFNSELELEAYAILYKSASNTDADANSWVWGYLDAEGKVLEPASNKGAMCISCHLQTGNIDYMLMNKFFP